MARTPAEREATEAIERALLQYRDAYAAAHPEARNGALVDWIVVAAEVLADGDPEDDETAYSVIMPHGGIPHYRAYGLLQMGQHYLTYGGNGD